MTTSKVALCADAMCLQHPEVMGLAGENLASQKWLRLFSSAEEARELLRVDREIGEVWVVSNDDIAPVNLAASLKKDRPDRFVYLAVFQESGSLKSRASAAGVDAFLSQQALVTRYTQRKHMYMLPCVDTQHPKPKMQPECPALSPAECAAPAVAANTAVPAVVPKDQHAVRTCPSPKEPFSSPSANSRKSAFLLPVVSGSGGSGKSTVAVLSALLLQRLGYNTLLLDFDLQFGDMPVLLGVQNPMHIEDILVTPARVAHLRSEKLMPALLAAPVRLEEAETVVLSTSKLLDLLTSCFDVIVCNTGAAWDEQHAVLLERSSKVLFLIDQRSSSIYACKHALDLCARCSIAANPFVFVLNRCAKGAPLTSIDVACALQGAHVAELKEGGRDVEDLLSVGAALDLIESKNDLCISLGCLLQEILPDLPCESPEEEDKKRLFGGRAPRSKSSRRRRRGTACL